MLNVMLGTKATLCFILCPIQVKVKVKFTLGQAMKADTGSSGIVLLFLQHRR